MSWTSNTCRRVPIYLLLAILCGTLAVSARTDKPWCVDDPYENPREDTCNPVRYIPQLWGAILSLTLYFVASILLTVQFWRYGGKYFLCLVIGGYCEGIGLTMRIPFRNDPHNTAIYIVQYLFIVLSPCAFLAADYILLGRIVRHLAADRHLRPIKPQRITLFFVMSDVITFCIQAAGGGLSSSQNRDAADVGQKIFLAGIIIQLASFAVFTCLYLLFGWRVYKHDPALRAQKWWRPLYLALGFTCIMFLIRSVFRAVELSQGYTGYLATHEIYVYLLDTLPLWLGLITYIPFWPARFLTHETRIPYEQDETIKVDALTLTEGSSVEMAAATTPMTEYEKTHQDGDGDGVKGEQGVLTTCLEAPVAQEDRATMTPSPPPHK